MHRPERPRYQQKMADSPDYFERILAKRTMRGSTSNGNGPSLFLLFESPHDKRWAELEFVKHWKSEDGFDHKRMRKIRWVFAIGKRETIRYHRRALEEGYKISTLVDMDQDIPGKELKKAKQIYTTSPACTLWTMQFVDGNGSLSEARLEAFIRSQFTNPNTVPISEIAENAANLTMKRLQNVNPLSEEKFRRKKWLKPINDHDLCDAITKELGADKKNQVERAMRDSALEDKNGLIRDLFRQMFNSVFADDGPHSRT